MGRTLCLLVLLVVVGYVSWRFILRQTTSRIIDTPQVEGGTLRVKVVRSGRYYFGSGHWGYGGGDDRAQLRFHVRGKAQVWHGRPDEEPRVLQVGRDAVFVVSQHDPGDVSQRDRLHFYRLSQDEWFEIGVDEFPHRLARCNLSQTGILWRSSAADAKRNMLPDFSEQRVQDLLDTMFSKRH